MGSALLITYINNFAKKLKTVGFNNLLKRQLADTWIRLAHAFSDRDHQANFIVFWLIDDFPNGVKIKTIHRAGVVSMRLSSQHQRLGKDTRAAHNFVTLGLRFATIVAIHGRHHILLHRLGGFCPNIFT